MIGLTEKGKTLGWTLALGIVLGLFGGWSLWRPRAPVVEPPAVSQKQPDGALLAARRPDTVIKVIHRIPPGYVPERMIAVGVQPDPVIIHDSIPVPGKPGEIIVKVDTVQAPPVQLQLSLLRSPDGARRVLLSAKGGKVLDSLTVDVPLGPSAAPPRSLPWSAGATYDQQSRVFGAFATRDLGPVRLVLAADGSGPNGQLTTKLGVGLRF